MKSIYIIVFTLLFIITPVFSKSSVKFGKVSMEDMKMTTYAPDTSASAVVLYKSGEIGLAQSKIFRRVKILKKSGVNYSTFRFNGLNTSNIRATVYNMENGKIVKEKVKNESIFHERITDNFNSIRIALPNVKVGTVYDIEFSGEFFISEFTFQEEIPIKSAKLRTNPSTYSSIRTRVVGVPVFKKTNENTYVAVDVPAFKSEPFINSDLNYISKLEFDPLRVNSIPGLRNAETDYSSSWDAVNDRLTQSRYFGQALISDASYLSELSDEISAKCSTPHEKLQAAYAAIQSLQWNEIETINTDDQPLAKTFKEQSGNSAELNFMLIQLLNRLDINAGPVVMSTRQKGMLNRVYPSYFKLNYVISKAEINGEAYLMDPSDNKAPLGILPKRCLNQSGRYLTNGGGNWVDLSPDKGENESVVYSLKLNEDLSLTGNIKYKRMDYSAYNWRSQFAEYANQDAYLENIENTNPGLRIETTKIKNVENIAVPIEDEYEVSIKNRVSEAGDLLTIEPFLFEKILENPFKSPTRQYPIDFAYTRKKTMIANYIIPESISVSEMPEPIYVKFPDNSASVFVKYEAKDNIVTVTYQFNINKSVFFASEYNYLRGIYSIIMEKQNQPIIFKKSDLAVQE